jgi:3-phenylpropionate/cinnamic acid dioxygenase small subunit
MSNPVQITNLLYRYAELMDAGQLQAAAELFRHAKIKVAGEDELQDCDGLLAIWRSWVKIYPCGTPRTKHVITNPIIELDEQEMAATCRSYWTVLQATEGFPLQVVGAGRYLDKFERVHGTWRFTFRDYSFYDLRGDMSRHLLQQI